MNSKYISNHNITIAEALKKLVTVDKNQSLLSIKIKILRGYYLMEIYVELC